jgi:ion channel
LWHQLAFGAAVSALNISIHALVMTTLVKSARSVAARTMTRHDSLLLMSVMIVTVSVLMAAHISEVALWSLAYAVVDAAPAGADRMYFAFVNYTTLGYGDITPTQGWRLLGPMTAMNGVLLFGWSTAVIFDVLRAALARTLTVTPP